MHYLVTGGAGFIGIHLVNELVLRGNHVTVFDNFTGDRGSHTIHKSEHVRIIDDDIREKLSLRTALKGVDGVFHLAGKISAPESFKKQQEYHDVNIQGTKNLIAECLRSTVRKIVFSSSCALYGEPSTLPTCERTPLNPLSPYAFTKLKAENLGKMQAQKGNLSFVALRYFNVYGEGQSPLSPYSGVISRFLYDISKNEPITIYGDGKQTRDFIHVQDVVTANIKAMAMNLKGFNLFNCCTGKAVSVMELIRTLELLFNTQVKKHYMPKRLGDVEESRGCLQKIKTQLGWLPHVSFLQGIRQLLHSSRSKTLLHK